MAFPVSRLGPPEEEALPKGHPCRADFDPNSSEAKEWALHQRSLESSEGLPPGYKFDPKRPHGGLQWELGVDPFHPEYTPHRGYVEKTPRAETVGAPAKATK